MNKTKVAYFGHPGSFSWMAAQRFAKKSKIVNYWLLPCESLEEVIDYVQIGESYGVVPYHNSSGGIVQTPLHFAKLYERLQVDEITMPVHQNLLGAGGSSLQTITAVVSHPQALVQCKAYLRKTLPNATQSVYSTTSTAAKDLSIGELPSTCAVIASKEAAKIYGLRVLAAHIEDGPNNKTTFKVLYKNNR